MQTGEVIFGGVGSGLYGMLMFAILGVFLSGLMVGRTPEFLGKKIEAREVKLTVIGTIGVPMLVLVTSALAIATEYGKKSIYNSGPQGWSETLYAYTSQANNNGSAFAGYTGFLQPADAAQFGITFANVLGGLAMLVRPLPAAARRARDRRLARRQARDARRRRHVPHRLADVRRRARRRGRARSRSSPSSPPCSSDPWSRA